MVTKYDIAAAAEIAGIAGKSLKLRAAQQREIFGGYVFGRQTIEVNLSGQGSVWVSRTFCFGTDSDARTWTLEEVAAAANGGRKLLVGA